MSYTYILIRAVMAVACQKREGESNEKLIGRWKKKTQQARIVKNVRGKMYFKRAESKTKEKDGAVVREKYRAKRRRNQFYS